jgi:hypothetical protein
MAAFATKRVKHFYTKPSGVKCLSAVSPQVTVELELCYNVEIVGEELTAEDTATLKWLMNAQIFESSTADGEGVTDVSQFSPFQSDNEGIIFEIGPRYSRSLNILQKEINNKIFNTYPSTVFNADSIFKHRSRPTRYPFVRRWALPASRE